MELTGIDKRNYVKLKILIFLHLIKEQQGQDVYLSSGQIARATNSKYCTVRTLLLARWNDRDWIQWHKDRRTGQMVKRLRHGFKFVTLTDLKGLGGGADYRYGFKITSVGETYLARAHRKAENDLKPELKYTWEKKLNYAYAEIARYNSPILSWYDHLARRSYFIRQPFEVRVKDGKPYSEDFGVKLDDMPTGKFCMGGMPEAFSVAEKLNIKPTAAFRAFVFSSIQIDERATQAHQPNPLPVPEKDYQQPYSPTGLKRLRMNINPTSIRNMRDLLSRNVESNNGDNGDNYGSAG
jgi:hypothetical protein